MRAEVVAAQLLHPSLPLPLLLPQRSSVDADGVRKLWLVLAPRLFPPGEQGELQLCFERVSGGWLLLSHPLA